MVEVRFNEWLNEGFRLFKAHAGLLILSSLIAGALAVATAGILAGPMGAGLCYIVLRLHDRDVPAPGPGDVFKGFAWFAQSLLFFLVWLIIGLIASSIVGLVPILGPVLSLAVSFVLQAYLMFGYFLIVDQHLGFWDASMQSIEVVRSNTSQFLGFGVVAAVIGSLGMVLCGLALIVTIPIQVCMLTVAYRDVFGGGEEADYGPSSMSPPPPPPGGDTRDFT